MQEIVARLLQSDDPSVRYIARRDLSGELILEDEEVAFSEEIRNSSRAIALLSEVASSGEILVHPYKKWYGAHRVLLALSDLEYPKREPRLRPLVEQVYSWILSSQFLGGIKEVRGLIRGHSCIIGNAVHYLCKLGFEDERLEKLTKLLLQMQWRDGGWNCDRKPSARSSSFNSTAIAIRGLASYSRALATSSFNSELKKGASFLIERELCKRKTTRQVASRDFLNFFFPEYYHYSILYGLKVISEATLPYDPNLDFALDYLKGLKTVAGWSTNKKYYWKSKAERAGRSLVSWETSQKGEVNDFVTVDSLRVIRYFEKSKDLTKFST